MLNIIWKYVNRIVCAIVIVYLLAPIAIIVVLSFSSAPFLTFPPPGFSLRWYDRLLADPIWLDSIVDTILITVPSTLLATLIGTAAAIGVARGRVPFPSIVTGFLMLPLIVPTIITAAAIYGTFRPWGLQGTFLGMILAHVLLSIPFVFSIVLASLNTIGPVVEGAASTLGASPLRVLFRITVPMISPAIISGVLFASVNSFDELIVSQFLSTPDLHPVAVQMWSDVKGQSDPTISAIATLLFVVTLVFLFADFFILRKRSSADAIPHH